MQTPSLNLFILDDNKSAAEELKAYLLRRFGKGISILIFNDRESCLGKIDQDTNIVIVNNIINDENGVDILKSIKKINPETEVIMLSEHESISSAIESFRAGVKGWVIKGPGSKKKVVSVITRIFKFPIRVIEKELGLPQRLAVFLLSFVTVVAIVLIYYYFFIKKT